MSDQAPTLTSKKPMKSGAVKSATDQIAVTAVMAAAALAVFVFVGTKQGLLLLLGAGLGITLYQADFGFTEGFTFLMTSGKTRKFRAQMVLLVLLSLIILPFMARGEFLGNGIGGKVIALNVSVLVGGFLFGIGMQLGGGCASGTLYDVGAGSMRMLLTLAAFIFGSLIGTFHVPWWKELPSFGKLNMVADYGLGVALAINLVFAGALWFGFLAYERKRTGKVEALHVPGEGAVSDVQTKQAGPFGFMVRRWPLLVGSIMLAVLSLLTLWVKGSPWGITSAFAIWGAKIFTFLGGDVSGYEYWQSEKNQKALSNSFLKHSTSIQDIGLIMGVFWAAWVSRRLKFNFSIAPKLAVQLTIGGFLLGYGARLASGCNIGAYLGGISSGSLHGWAWLAIAFLGNLVGLKIKRTVFN